MPGSSTPPPKAGYMAATDSLPSFHSSVANAGRTGHTCSCRQPSRERRAGLRRALRPCTVVLDAGGYRKLRCSHEIRRPENAQQQAERIRTAGRRGRDGAGDRPRPCRRGNRSAEGGAEPHSGRRHAGRCGTKGLAEAPGGARLGASSRTTPRSCRWTSFSGSWTRIDASGDLR